MIARLIILAIVCCAASASFAAEEQNLSISEIRASRRMKRESGGLSGGLGISQSMGVTAREGTSHSLRAELEYGFARTWSVEVQGSYRRPYAEPDPSYNGFGDVSFGLKNSGLYRDEDAGFGLSGHLGYVIPLSRRSKRSTLEDAYEVGLRARQRLGGGVSLGLSSEVGRYFFEYETSDSAGTRYNKPYSWNNGVNLSTRFLEACEASVGASMKTSLDYADSVSRSYQVRASVSWAALDNTSVSGGVRTTKSERTGRRDDGDEAEESASGSEGGEGPSGANLFDADSTSFNVGLSYRF